MNMKRWQRIGLAAAAVLVPALSCGQRSLVLLDVKASTLFADPSQLLNVQLTLTANRDLTTRFHKIRLYLPSDMNGTVNFDAQIDNGDCIIGMGMATATGVQSGETSQAIQLLINPSSPACIPIGDGGAG